MKKLLLALIGIIGLSSHIYAIDTICPGGNCDGIDKVAIAGSSISASSPVDQFVITANGGVFQVNKTSVQFNGSPVGSGGSVTNPLSGALEANGYAINNSSSISLSGTSGSSISTTNDQLVISAGGGVFQVNSSSAQIHGGLSFVSTTSLSLQWAGTSPSTAVVTLAQVGTSSFTKAGLVCFPGLTGSSSTVAYFIGKMDRLARGTSAYISMFSTLSSGPLSGNDIARYTVSVATGSQSSSPENLNFVSSATVVITSEVTGTSGGQRDIQSSILIPSLQDITGSGNCLLWFKITRITGSSSAESWLLYPEVIYRKQW